MSGTLRAMGTLLVVGAGVLGLLVGSFANVVTHRVPLGESVVSPPSACPGCAAPIGPLDNVPVISWLALGGRCRHCREPISPRYPLMELASAGVFALVAWRIGPDPALPGLLLFVWLLLVVSVIDAQTRKIPNRLTYPLAPVVAVLLVGAALVQGEPMVAARTLAGGLVAFVAILAIALVSPRGMGMGDVKLAGIIGLGLGYLGWAEVVVGLFGGFLIGGLVAIGLIVTRRRQRKDQIPFGPYLAAGALVALLAGRSIAEAYLRATGLA